MKRISVPLLLLTLSLAMLFGCSTNSGDASSEGLNARYSIDNFDTSITLKGIEGNYAYDYNNSDIISSLGYGEENFAKYDESANKQAETIVYDREGCELVLSGLDNDNPIVSVDGVGYKTFKVTASGGSSLTFKIDNIYIDNIGDTERLFDLKTSVTLGGESCSIFFDDEKINIAFDEDGKVFSVTYFNVV